MKMLKLTAFFFLLMSTLVLAEDKKDSTTPKNDTAQSMEIEKIKLEIERLKLENERLQLQIQSQKMSQTEPRETAGTIEKKEEPKEEKKDEKKVQEKVITEWAQKSEELAKQNLSNEKLVVLDFVNGEIWHKGIRYNLNQFLHLLEDEKWKYKSEFVKLSVNGDSEYRYRYKNMYLEKYQNYSKGVFVFEGTNKPDDFEFVTPEGIAQDSTKGMIRNKFASAYLIFDYENKEKDWQVLRYKHGNGFFDFDDVVEFWLDKQNKISFLKYGMVDKK